MRRFDKWVRRTILSAVLGVSGLAAANIFGFGLGLSIVNVIVTVALGIPGLALLMGVRWLF